MVTAQRAEQLNRVTYGTYNLSLFRKDKNGKRILPLSAVFVGGCVGTFSEMNAGKITKTCFAKYRRFTSTYNIAPVTVYRSLQLLNQKQYIVRDQECASAYAFRTENIYNEFYRLDDIFFTKPFNIGNVKRTLRHAEIAVLMYLYTKCRVKVGESYANVEHRTTVKEISQTLGLHPKTVRKAYNVLFDLRLIYRRKTDMPRVYAFGLKSGAFRQIERESKRAAQAERKATESREPSRLLAERERYYSDLRAHAELIADRNEERAQKYMPYEKARKTFTGLSIQLAYSEVANDAVKSRELSDKLKLSEQARLDALKQLGLTEADLQPQYRCKQCNDTGYLPNGKMCDCYPYR